MRTTRAQRLQKMRKSRRRMSHVVRCMCAASVRVPRVWRALFAPKLRKFSIENRAIFALKFLKISAIAATDARRTRTTNSNNHFMQDAQVAQVVLSSATVFCSEIGRKTSRFSLEIAQVSMNFDALFAQHTRPAPAKRSQTSQECVSH